VIIYIDGLETITDRYAPAAGEAILNNSFEYVVGGGTDKSSLQSVSKLDISSETPCWIKYTSRFYININI